MPREESDFYPTVQTKPSSLLHGTEGAHDVLEIGRLELAQERAALLEDEVLGRTILIVRKYFKVLPRP